MEYVCMKQGLQMLVFLIKQSQSCLNLQFASVHSWYRINAFPEIEFPVNNTLDDGSWISRISKPVPCGEAFGFAYQLS